MKRLFDIILALLAAILLCVPGLAVALVIKMFSRGPVFYWSDRIGKDNEVFRMPKFRTMGLDTPAVATHLLQDPKCYLIPVGSFLRKSSIDEIPQLYSIIKGDMSFVGPRPALYNQHDLVRLRTAKGVHVLPPGLTGWAQINGRDELSITVKVEYDEYYLKHRSFTFDMRILVKTLIKVIGNDGVSH